MIDGMPQRTQTSYSFFLEKALGLADENNLYVERAMLAGNGMKSSQKQLHFPPLGAQKGLSSLLNSRVAQNVEAGNSVLQKNHPMYQEDLKFNIFEPSILNGELVVVCPEEEFQGNLKRWAHTIIGFVIEMLQEC